MKIQIPEGLKMTAPSNAWGKILTATPVIMTVVATALAGLASSEMTRAQYARSLGAQQQAKAGDQWSFFQAKRLRASLQSATLDLLRATTDVRPLGAELTAKLDSGAAAALLRGELPAPPKPAPVTPNVQTALDLLAAGRPDAEIAAALSRVPDRSLTDAVLAARARADTFDAATSPINRALDTLEQSLAGGPRDTLRDFTAARAR